MRLRFTIWFEGLSSPERFSMFSQALMVLFGAAGFWIAGAFLLSLLGCWVVMPLAIALIVYVAVQSYRKSRSETWANEGRCAACGYDLRATPLRCPECGRDATADEPTWRKLRRHREALLQQQNPPIPTPQQNRDRLLAPLPVENSK